MHAHYFVRRMADRNRLLELLLLANAIKNATTEDRPDNFYELPSDDNRVWRELFKKCKEGYMVVGIEFTTSEVIQKEIRMNILKLARKFNRQVIFLRASIFANNTHDEVGSN